jgi:hypothetical protein
MAKMRTVYRDSANGYDVAKIILSSPHRSRLGVSESENGTLVLALAMGNAETSEKVF